MDGLFVKRGSSRLSGLGWCGFAAMLCGLAAAALAWGYFGRESAVTAAFGLAAMVPHGFFLALAAVGLPGALLCALTRRAGLRFAILTVLASLFAVALVADIIVYAQYRFHISPAMLDLFFNAGDTIAFSWQVWLEIAGIAAAIALACAALVWAAGRLAQRFRFRLWIPLAFTLLWAVQAGVYMVSFAQFNPQILAVRGCLPLYPTVRAQKFLAKLGFKTQAVRTGASVRALNYPKKPPVFQAPAQPLNILFVMADSLRADMLNPSVMPYTHQWVQQAVRFERHYSSSNATRAGLFGLFYSLPPSYWHAALETRTPPVLMDALQAQGYDIQAFATAPLTNPEFDRTVFAKVHPLRLKSHGRDSVECDENSAQDFIGFLNGRKGQAQKRPFFAFVFFDTTHGYHHPKGMTPFKPEWESPKYVELNSKTDPTPFFNLYKNSAYWTDRLFERVLKALEASGEAGRTIVVVSSDHGQEMNDSGKNFWGHNSAFDDAQTRIPLAIRWPGQAPRTEKRLTVSYDIPATLLKNALGMTSPLRDTGIGLDLWTADLAARKWFPLASYSETAIREIDPDRIIEIDQVGLLHFYDGAYNPSSNTRRTPNIAETLRLSTEWAH